MIKVITYTDSRMTISAQKCIQSAMSHGADAYGIWTPADLPYYFQVVAKDILKHERGAGYWVWKSFIIFQELMALKEDDILIYCDAGLEWIESVKHMTPDESGFFFFDNGWPHLQWTKGDILQAIPCNWNIDINPQRFNAKFTQVQASAMAFRANGNTRKFVQEWLTWCLHPGLIDDSPSIYPNHPIFTENRHDQAILSSLAIKYDIPKHWWASTVWVNERWRYHDDRYPALFLHHRKRNDQWV